MIVDNFALTNFTTCAAKFKLRMEDGWTTKWKSGALGFGGALHEGLAAWYKTKDASKALMAIHEKWPSNTPPDDYRTKEKCLNVMIEYIKRYPVESFKIVGLDQGEPLVEVSFTLDTDMKVQFCSSCLMVAVSGSGNATLCGNCNKPLEEILYGGIFDGLVDFNGAIYTLEHKTTSQLGAYYFNQFKPNNQISGYDWAAGKLTGYRVGGSLVNAVGVYKVGATKFERQITTRSDAEVREWLRNVQSVCTQIAIARATNRWPMSTMACTLYGQCEYHGVHSLANEAEREKYLEMQYIRQPWSHEDRDDKKEKSDG